MTQRLVSTAIWGDIAKLAKTAKVRRAAIAYVTDLSSLPLRASDTLVTDASDAAIASGSTDAATLQEAINAGVEVFSLRGLHAKVMRLDGVAVVGSGNLSRTSRDRLIEAAIITDDPVIVARVDTFIDSLEAQGTRLTKKSVAQLMTIPVAPRIHIGGKREKVAAVAQPATWILGLPEQEVDTDEDAVEKQVAQVKLEVGSDTEVEEFYWSKKSRFSRQVKTGDFVISVYRPNKQNRAPRTIKVYRPAWVKRIVPTPNKYTAMAFVIASPRSDLLRPLSWPDFKAMTDMSGISKVTPDSQVLLTEPQRRSLFAQWEA